MISYQPNPDEWDKGARYLACIIYQNSPDGPVSRELRLDGVGAATPVELDVGVCLNDELPVDCDDPHQVEIFAVDEYEAPDDDVFPGVGAWEDLTEACTERFEVFEVADGPAEVEPFMMTDMYFGWDNGLRTYYCVAQATEDGLGVSTVGSMTGDWDLAPDQLDT